MDVAGHAASQLMSGRRGAFEGTTAGAGADRLRETFVDHSSTKEFLLLLLVPHVVSPARAVDWCADAAPLKSSLHTSVHADEAARDDWLRALAMTGPRASTHTAHIARWRVTTWRKRVAVRVGIAGVRGPPRRRTDSDIVKTLKTLPA